MHILTMFFAIRITIEATDVKEISTKISFNRKKKKDIYEVTQAHSLFFAIITSVSYALSQDTFRVRIEYSPTLISSISILINTAHIILLIMNRPIKYFYIL